MPQGTPPDGMTPSPSNGRDYAVACDYWSKDAATAERPEQAGCPPIGDCGLVESLYRHFEESRNLRKLVAFEKRHKVLELGCGNGRWTLALAPLVNHYTGVDFSEQMLSIARKRAGADRLSNTSFACAKAQDFLPDGKVDVLYLGGVSQYIHDGDLSAMLSRLHGHVAEKGVLIDRSTVHFQTRSSLDEDDCFCIYRTPEEIESIFSEAGFRLRIRTPSHIHLNFPNFARRILKTNFASHAVEACAPMSFHALRMAAYATRAILGRRGWEAEFSHDFFIFEKV